MAGHLRRASSSQHLVLSSTDCHLVNSVRRVTAPGNNGTVSFSRYTTSPGAYTDFWGPWYVTADGESNMSNFTAASFDVEGEFAQARAICDATPWKSFSGTSYAPRVILNHGRRYGSDSIQSESFVRNGQTVSRSRMLQWVGLSIEDFAQRRQIFRSASIAAEAANAGFTLECTLGVTYGCSDEYHLGFKFGAFTSDTPYGNELWPDPSATESFYPVYYTRWGTTMTVTLSGLVPRMYLYYTVCMSTDLVDASYYYRNSNQRFLGTADTEISVGLQSVAYGS